MPIYSMQQGRRRPVVRTSGGGWTDVNVYRRNAAGTGWDLISLGLPNLVATGSGTFRLVQAEPAPATAVVTNGGAAITPTGGFGAFTYTWTRTSGDASMTIVANGGTNQPTFSATVNKNTSKSATWQVSVYDQQTGRTETLSRTITLEYATNL